MNLQALIPRSWPGRQRALSPLRRFWRWWSGELIHFVPPRIREAFDRQERILRIAVRDSDLHVDYHHGDVRERLDRISMVNAPVAEAAADAPVPEADRSIVELSPAQAARRLVRLPMGAEDQLRDVIGYEMDRLTPFAASDVYYDFEVVSRDVSRRTLEVDLVIALRTGVDAILALLAERGIEPSQLTVTGGAPSLNLLPREHRKARASRLRIVPTLLSALAAILAIVIVAYPLVQQRIELRQLQREVAELRPTALAADKVRTDIAAAVEQGNFFAARRNAGPTKISVLNELAGVIPDDTWLTRVQVDGTTVRIHGESEGASSLIGLIDQSEIFADPKFSSPVTKNPRTGNDRFVIEATIGIREAPQ
jgi:general secretion pathway protein L